MDNKRIGLRGQEEMVGFGLIIIIVAIILVIFLGFTLNKPPKESLTSGEVENFLNAVLSYTTECRDERNIEFLSIRKLIIECSNGLSCYDKQDSCEMLKNDLKEITEKSWDMTRYKGYEMKVITQNKTLIPATISGNTSGNDKGYIEEIDDNLEIMFKIYYN